MTAYVHGPESKNYDFTSALPVQLLVVLAPSLMPLIEPHAAPKPGAAPALIVKAGGVAPETAKPALQACGG
jgi:hypothetical protein